MRPRPRVECAAEEAVTPATATRSLFESAFARVEWDCCRRSHPGPSGEERKTEHQIMVPLSGVNVRHVDGEALTVSPSRITLSNRGEPYRVSHPYGSGETALILILREDLLREILRADDRPARWRDVLTHVAVLAGASPPEPGGRERMPSFRVRNDRARDALGWAPLYPDHHAGLAR